MKRLLASVVVVGLVLAGVLTVTSEVGARGPGSRSPRVGYSLTRYNGAYPRQSYFALSRGFNGWSSWYWNARFRCYLYWYPRGRCYYYWYAPALCYYPISYIDAYPPPALPYQTPAVGAAPWPSHVQVTSVNQNGQNGPLPAVSGPVPAAGR
jgi:hypothetical protein